METVVAHSQASIRAGSRSFAAAARLFAPDIRDDVVMLYAWCRHCDDQIDGQEHGYARATATPAAASATLDQLRTQTLAAIHGEETVEPAFVALGRAMRRHSIAPEYALDLLDGFAMDVAGRTYRSIDDTLAYSYHVAGTVGVMMACIMGARDPDTLLRAADLGIAFQLTNIARDVSDDARMGRVYLPQAWLEQERLTVDDVGREASWPAVTRVVARLLDTAEPYYASARIGLRRLPLRSAWAIAAALGIYRAIGRGVRRRGPEAWNARVSTGSMTKIAWILRGGAEAASARTFGRWMTEPPRRGLWTKSAAE